MKILTFDIETSPHISAHFGRWQQNIRPENTLYESRVICWAAKWYDDDATMFMSEWEDGREEMLSTMWDLLDEADTVVSFNGKKFDSKRLNSEFLEEGWGPPSPYAHVDLCQQVKKHFAFSSNRLKHLLKKLGLTPKVEEDVDIDLWLDVCWHEDAKAQQIMQDYNIQDVGSTEELYDYCLGWIKPHPNWGLFIDDVSEERPVCPNCGSRHLVKKGTERTKVRAYQRWKCRDCGAHHRGRRNIGPGGVENGVLS